MSKREATLLTILCAVLLTWAIVRAATPRSVGATVVTIAKGLAHPWGLAFLPDGRYLVTERGGTMRYVSETGQISPPLTGIPPVLAEGQGGLLDVALDPEFARNRIIYLSYSEPEGSLAGTAVAKGVLTETGLDGVQVIFRQIPKVSSPVHFGSRLVFSPDGKLFVTLGERGQRDQAQNMGTHLGKLVRIDPDGSVPSDNPFKGRPDALPEIWSFGHRNPQGAAFHPRTGRLWIHEHGARGGDEINLPQPGLNYGWPVITFGRDYSGEKIGEGIEKEGMEQPVYYWDPSIAPSGMTFYLSNRFPGWTGSLFIGSLKFGLLVRLELDGMKVLREERLLESEGWRIRDVREGPDGYLYVLTDEPDGRLLRVSPG